MNLSMPQSVVQDLAERGRLGAVKLVETFAGGRPGIEAAPGWDNHRWVRFRTATSGLGHWLRALATNYRDGTSGATPYSALAGRGANATLPSYKPTTTERQRLNERTDELLNLAAHWRHDELNTSDPKPAPRLRLVPDDGTAAVSEVQD